MDQRILLNYYKDQSHGWIRVKHALIKSLKLENKISDFSYYDQDKKLIYLEHDIDAPLFIKEYKKHNPEVDIQLSIIECYGESFIRSLQRFKSK